MTRWRVAPSIIEGQQRSKTGRMELSEFKRTDYKHRGKKRRGRGAGSGLGKTSGRGDSGVGSRSGGTIAIWFEGGQMPLFRRLPKRGFNNVRFRKKVRRRRKGAVPTAP
jgi:ribosomal protein L15